MQTLRDVLRLKHQAGLSHRQIGASLKLSVGVITKYLQRAEAAGIAWPLPEGMTDAELTRLLQPPRQSPDHPHSPVEPDCAEIVSDPESTP